MTTNDYRDSLDSALERIAGNEMQIEFLTGSINQHQLKTEIYDQAMESLINILDRTNHEKASQLVKDELERIRGLL